MQLIPNQPIDFGSYFETKVCPPCKDDTQYCALYNHGDTLTAEWIADPCSSDLICNSQFTTSELVTNGDFGGDDAGWTDAVGGIWSYNTDKEHCNGAGNLAQPINLFNGTKYILSYSLLNVVSGSITFYADGNVMDFQAVAADGHYQVIYNAAVDTTMFYIGGNGEYDVTNVSIIAVPDCWDIEDEGWTFNDGNACHDGSDGFTGALINTDVVLISETYYKVSITIAGLTDGSIDVYLGGAAFSFFSNGTFTIFITAGSTDTIFKIIPTSDFDGCISGISLFKYPALDDFKLIVIDENGNIVDDIGSGNLGYANDFVNLLWSVPNTLGGCYKICVTEICPQPLSWDNWTIVVEDDATIVINNKLTFTGDAGSGHSTAEHDVGVLQPQIGPIQTCTYTVKIRFGTIDPSYEGLDLVIDLGDASVTTTIDNTFDNNTKSFDFIPSPTISGTIKLTFDDFGSTGSLEILYIIINSSCDGQQDPDFCSNCINIKESHECTFQLVASCKEPSLGFNFTNFFLYQRLRCSFMNPIGQGANQNYKLSDGSYYKNFAERDKVFDLVFLPVDENIHDSIDTMLRCNFFLMDNHSYTWLDSDYKPEWSKNGAVKLVESRIQIRRTGGHLTNSNCS